MMQIEFKPDKYITFAGNGAEYSEWQRKVLAKYMVAKQVSQQFLIVNNGTIEEPKYDIHKIMVFACLMNNAIKKKLINQKEK